MAKARESGMPAETLWESFFRPQQVLDRLLLPCGTRRGVCIAEFGCGYGTFTIPAAQRSQGVVHALDIDPEMVARTLAMARAAGLSNVQAEVRDFISQGSGLPDSCADYCLLFNILHLEDPLRLLREARRLLKPGGLLGVMHWKYDPATPRGPSMAIRPRPEQCRNWAIEAGFSDKLGLVDLPPFHYGLVFEKSALGEADP